MNLGSCDEPATLEQGAINALGNVRPAIHPDARVVGETLGPNNNFEIVRILPRTNQHTFYTYDANYNVTAALDRYGNVLERYTYTPYGERTVIDDDWSSDSDGLSDIASNFGHQGGVIDTESGLMKFDFRDYHVSLGTWMEADPLGYHDGMNLRQAYLSNPLINLDPMGLMSVGGITISVVQLGIVALLMIGGLSLRVADWAVHPSGDFRWTSGLDEQAQFDAWYQKQVSRGNWWATLEPCPCEIQTCGQDKVPANPDSTKWENPKKPHGHELALHPGAVWSMRSIPDSNNHANQCIYDARGKLISRPSGAGTVDYYKSETRQHFSEDVAAILVANKLDGGSANDSYLYAMPFQIPGIPETIKRTPGPNMMKYYQVRPSHHNNCP